MEDTGDWKVLRGRYKRLVKESLQPVVEKWFNKVAQPSQQKAFKQLVKSLFECRDTASVTELPTDPHHPDVHRANMMYQMYAQPIVNGSCREFILKWLFVATPMQQDQFRNVFTALNSTVADAAPRSKHQTDFADEPGLSGSRPPAATRHGNAPLQIDPRQHLRQAKERPTTSNSNHSPIPFLNPRYRDPAIVAAAAEELLLEAEERQAEELRCLFFNEPEEPIATPEEKAIEVDENVLGDGLMVLDVQLHEAKLRAIDRGHKGLAAKVYKPKRFQPPWQSRIGYKTVVEPDQKLLSKPLRRAYDVEAPWYCGPLNAPTTTSIDSYKHFPNDTIDRYRTNADRASFARAVCNPSHTASVGCTVPPLLGLAGTALRPRSVAR